MTPALLIIDLQKDFFTKPRLAEQQSELITHTNLLLNIVRTHHLPVIWVRQIIKADLSDAPKPVRISGRGQVLEGTPGSELLDGLNKKPEDLEIIKKRYSGFYNTNLDTLLRNLSVDTLIVAGINTHACVRTTTIDAYQRDYDVIVAKDCVTSWDDEHHRVSLRYFEPTIAKVATNTEIASMLNQENEKGPHDSRS